MAFLLARDGHRGGLGLGWLLVIALGGGIVVFMVIGLLLAWRLQSKNKIKTARVYSYTVGPLSRGHSTMKLSKRRLLASDYSTSRLSSRLSMSLPRLSLLPPLPSYQSFFRGGGEPAVSGVERSDSIMMARWTEEEGKQKKRDSWIGSLRDSWLGRAPTLPNVDIEPDIRTEPKRFGHPYMQDWAMGQRLPLSDDMELQGSRTEPTLGRDRQRDDVEEYRGRQRAKTSERPTQPFAEDQDLRTILQSTEQRLRSGSSQSPVKTPRSSPHKSSSPRKTPRSHMTTSSGGSMRANRGTPNPSKRTPGRGTPGGISQHGSTTSIGSAANSLIAEATQQLELPGGSSSTSRDLQGHEWELQPQSQHPLYHEEEEQKQQLQTQLESANVQNEIQYAQSSSSPQKHNPHHYRRRSVDSDVSSSLSTVYSTNEPEEAEPNVDESDPFVEAGGVRRSLTTRSAHRFNGPRPLRRRSQTIADSGGTSQQEQLRAPFNLRRVSKDWSHSRPERQGDAIVPPVSFDPPLTTDENEQSLTAASSESSMVTISVHTTDDEDEQGDLPTPKASQTRHFIPGADTGGESTPTKVRTSLDISSSPLNEQDILRLLLSSSNRRALPHPPLGAAYDSPAVPTPLRPQPKSSHGSPLAKISISRRSSSSSDYDRESLADTVVDEQIPRCPSRASSIASRQSMVRSARDLPGVTSTVAELRRMNSLVSSYSCASMASTALGESETTPNLSSLPSLKSGSLNVVPPRAKPGSIGSKHYLSLGKSSPPKKTGSGGTRKDQQQQQQQQSLAKSRPPSRAGHRRTQSVDEGKENQHGLGLKMPRIEISSPASSTHSSPTKHNGVGLREGRKGGNLGREPSLSSTSSTRGRSKLLPVQEGTEESRLTAGDKASTQQEARPESLGLYDSDGFLIGSPDREKRMSRSLR